MRFLGFRKQNKNTDESNKGKNTLKIKLQKFKDQCRNTNKNNKRENVDEISKHIKKLGSWSENDRKYAANFFANAAEKGQCVPLLAVDALLCALIMDCDSVREDAVRALTYYYLNKKDENGIMRLLGHKRNDVRENVSVVLANAAEKGQDITLAVPYLNKALLDKDAYVKLYATMALAYHYLDKGNQKELNKLLNHEDPDVRKWAIQAQKAY